MLTPPTKDNATSRLLCHVRRATSLARIKDLNASLKDFEAALRLDPDNAALAKDADVVRACLKAHSDDEEDRTQASIDCQEEEDEEESEFLSGSSC